MKTPGLIENNSEEIKSLFNIDQIKKQFTYSEDEDLDTLGSTDPQGEEEYKATSRLIHRYKNRAAFLTTDKCFAYCRHCFRRRFSGKEEREATREEILEAASYLKDRNEIKEVLLTGGDLFTLSDLSLDFLLSTLKEAREDIIYRLCTRSLLSNPNRFTPSLFEVIEKYNYGAPYYLMTQFNHPNEITEKAVDIVNKFLKLGIIAFNQAVLLRGVNDSVETQVELCNKLLRNRIKPYYLFQGDFVKGTSHLRVPLSKGLEIERGMRKNLSGLAMPEYTIDLPECGGKVVLTDNHIKSFSNGTWTLTNINGEERYYPEDK